MIRPDCPKCHRKSVIANSHRSGDLRVQYFGCVKCGVWSLGSAVVRVTAKRTRAVIGRLMRTPSGRFAKAG